MTATDDKGLLRGRSRSLVNVLAKTAIAKVKTPANPGQNLRLDVATKMLIAKILDRSVFDLGEVCEELETLRITNSEVIDHCIPEAANRLGVDWLNDTLTFGEVSTASARLFGLCKAMSEDWTETRNLKSGHHLLVATLEKEDHLIGPTVLIEQLRRLGHSVDALLNTNQDKIARRIATEHHTALMISVASYQTLDIAADAIRHVRQMAGIEIPILLGGAILDHEENLQQKTGADFVTKHIETALNVIDTRYFGVQVAE